MSEQEGAVVVGLGNIGAAIARCVVDAGRAVHGVDLDPDRRAEFEQATGAPASDSLADVPWTGIGHVMVVVRLTDQVTPVLDELARLQLADDTTVYVLTTLDVEFARGLGDRTDPFALVELPVSGGAAGARAGTLAVMPAGELGDRAEQFLLDTIAQHVTPFERFGDSSLAKLLNNVTAAYNARALAEILLLGDRLGLDARTVWELIQVASGGSWMASAYLDLVDDLLEKDVALLREHVGELPTLSLDADTDLPERLAEARSLLGGPSD